MRLGINGWRLHGQRTGVGRYLLNLVSRWDADSVAGLFDEVTFYSPRPLDRSEVPLPASMRERVLRPDLRMLPWENLRLGPGANDDVLFCPSYSRPLVSRARPVVMIYDATSQMHPNLYGRHQRWYNRLYGWSARHAALVLTSTEAARAEISAAWDVPSDRIRVTPLAAAESFAVLDDEDRLDSLRTRFTDGDPYFLMVGSMSGRRRIPVLLEALSEFRRVTELPHRLLLVGARPTPVVDALVARLGLGNRVHYSGFVSDADLNAIYNAAEAVISAGIHETVSLPILEAQATGAPVICVDTPGSREMTGGFAEFLPRLDPESLAAAMVRLAQQPDRRRRLRLHGLDHSATFSWDRTARETLLALAEVARQPVSA